MRDGHAYEISRSFFRAQKLLSDMQRKVRMAKMIFSLGFWMTIVLFIALGYALAYVIDEKGLGSSYNVAGSFTPPALHDKNRSVESDQSAAEIAARKVCAPQTASRDDDVLFRQVTSVQAADRAYAPGMSFSITHHPSRIRICPGPIKIPPLY
jgi:hypothetical protein